MLSLSTTLRTITMKLLLLLLAVAFGRRCLPYSSLLNLMDHILCSMLLNVIYFLEICINTKQISQHGAKAMAARQQCLGKTRKACACVAPRNGEVRYKNVHWWYQFRNNDKNTNTAKTHSRSTQFEIFHPAAGARCCHDCGHTCTHPALLIRIYLWMSHSVGVSGCSLAHPQHILDFMLRWLILIVEDASHTDYMHIGAQLTTAPNQHRKVESILRKCFPIIFPALAQ